MHYSWLTLKDRNLIDTWQVRTLRRTLGIKVSMISRIRNTYVLEQAKTTPFSQQLQAQQIKYFGHVVRAAERREHIYTVSFSNAGNPRKLSSKQRKGRPYDKWIPKMLVKTSQLLKKPRPYAPQKLAQYVLT